MVSVSPAGRLENACTVTRSWFSETSRSVPVVTPETSVTGTGEGDGDATPEGRGRLDGGTGPLVGVVTAAGATWALEVLVSAGVSASTLSITASPLSLLSLLSPLSLLSLLSEPELSPLSEL